MDAHLCMPTYSLLTRINCALTNTHALAQAAAWKAKQQERKQALLERFARKQRAIARQREASAAAAASLSAAAGRAASSNV